MPLSNTQVSVSLKKSRVDEIRNELTRLPLRVGLSKAVMTMRGIFKELSRSAGNSQRRYVSVIITNGNVTHAIDLTTGLRQSVAKYGFDVISVGKTTYG